MLLPLLAASALAVPLPCATLEMLPSATPLRRVLAAAPPTGALGLRDTYGLPNLLPGEHFVVRWGDSGGVTQTEAERLLDAFELAWSVQVEDMAHPAPATTDTHLFNVYIGDSGSGAPDSYGAAGYYWTDEEGWPLIVVAAGLLGDPEYADATAAHEFYHAVQGSLARFDYSGLGAWFWEATAEWAAIETLPDNPTTGDLIFGYLLLPHLPVNAFNYIDSGALEEYHQYGAFLFPHYLTTEVTDYQLVRDAWVVPGEDPDPVEVMRAWLAAEDVDLNEVWLDHIAHNAVYDYANGADWESLVDWVETWYDDARPITATHEGAGTTEPDRIAGPSKAPRRYGYNLIVLEDPFEGELTVEITGDELGGSGSPARFGARLVRITNGVPVYDEIPFDGTVGALTVQLTEEDEVRLVVGAWTEATTSWSSEIFPYAYSLSVDGAPAESESHPIQALEREEEVRACGCAAAPGMFGRFGWPLAALLLITSRRRSRRPGTT